MAGANERKETGLKVFYCKSILGVRAAQTIRHCHGFAPEGNTEQGCFAPKPVRSCLDPHSDSSCSPGSSSPSFPSLPFPPSCGFRPSQQARGCRSSYRPEALMALVAAECPSSREWMKTSVLFSPPMKVSCQGDTRGHVGVRGPGHARQPSSLSLPPTGHGSVWENPSMFSKHVSAAAWGGTCL